MANAMGRPRTIKSPEEFDMLVDAYIHECRMTREPVNTVDLALYLGFNSKTSLYDYGTNKGFEEFTASVKRARALVEASYLRRTLKGEGAGPIFLLKASYNYVDRQVVDVNATGEIKVVMTEDQMNL